MKETKTKNETPRSNNSIGIRRKSKKNVISVLKEAKRVYIFMKRDIKDICLYSENKKTLGNENNDNKNEQFHTDGKILESSIDRIYTEKRWMG